MTQKQLMKIFYLLIVATLGTIWPWISANAQTSSCDILNVIATFNYTPAPPAQPYTIECTTQFTCPAGSHCSSNASISVNLSSSLNCHRTSTPAPSPCSDSAPGGTASYNPPQNVLKSDVVFRKPACTCDTITFKNGSNLVRAASCRGGVFPGTLSQAANLDGTYRIETPDSPNCH